MSQDYEENFKRHIAKFDAKTQKRAEAAARFMYANIKRGHNVEQALSILSKTMPEVFNIFGLKEALVEVACYGYGIMPKLVTSADKAKIAKVLDQPWSADGMKLSEKLHTASEVMHKAIRDTVAAQINKNATAKQIAMELYDGYKSGRGVVRAQELPQYLEKIVRLQGTREDSADIRRALENIKRLSLKGAPNQALKSSYNLLVEAVEAGNDKAIQRAINTAIQEKSRYVAERIARTEMARAYSDGYFSRHQKDPDVIGYQLELGTRHPVFDICDVYADCDMFNLGKGVYPKDNLPMVPIHPHCLCTYHALYKGQLDLGKQKEQGDKALVKYLDNLTPEQRKRLLGVEGADNFSKTGKAVLQDVRGWNDLCEPMPRKIDIATDIDETIEKQNAVAVGIDNKTKVQGFAVDDFPAAFHLKGNMAYTKNFIQYLNNNLSGMSEEIAELWKNAAVINDGFDWKIVHKKGHHCRRWISEISIPRMLTAEDFASVHTIAHELGHFFDTMAAAKSGSSGYWLSAEYKPLTDAIGKIQNGFKMSQKLYAKVEEFGKIRADIIKERSKKIKELYNSDKGIGGDQLLKKRNAIIEEYNLKIVAAGKGCTNFEDILDALSGGEYWDKRYIYWGHGSKYYSTRVNVPSEIAANYVALQTANPQLIKLLSEELPELVEALEGWNKDVLRITGVRK